MRVIGLAVGLALAPLAARAQQAGKVYRIGILSAEVLPPGLLQSFQEGLRELGYVEGKNLAIESRDAGGKNDRPAFYTTGVEHSPTSATGTAWERTPWHATQRAAWEALNARDNDT